MYLADSKNEVDELQSRHKFAPSNNNLVCQMCERNNCTWESVCAVRTRRPGTFGLHFKCVRIFPVEQLIRKIRM